MKISPAVSSLLRLALKEDLGAGDGLKAALDITTRATVASKSVSKAALVAKEPLVLAGVPFVKEIFRILDKKVRFRVFFKEGQRVGKNAVLAEIRGNSRAILSGERTALNLLQRMCGIATLTSAFVEQTRGTGARVFDTRKTAPGMRELDKYAVRTGGGSNHRMGLWDSVLVKDNHIAAAGGVARAVGLVRKRHPKLPVQVEVRTFRELREALDAGADVVMLDNMGVARTKRAVEITAGRALLEASGNVTLRNVRSVALTGVDMISAGALTHSAPASDISLVITG